MHISFLFCICKVQQEFVNNMENTSVESLIQKLAESKGTGKERPGNTLTAFIFSTALVLLLI